MRTSRIRSGCGRPSLRRRIQSGNGVEAYLILAEPTARTHWGDPVDWLSGDCGDVIEVGVVVEDRRAVIFCCCGGQQVHHTSGSMLTNCRH